MRLGRSVQLATCLVFFASSPHAADTTIDIRTCPLDTLVFVDPWGGERFVVKRVGTNYGYICDDGKWSQDASCRGPFGDLVLEGELFDDDDDVSGEGMVATYSVIKGAPCCDWSVSASAERTAAEGFAWLDASDVPALGDQSWLSIESDYGEDFGNPMFAAACTTRN